MPRDCEWQQMALAFESPLSHIIPKMDGGLQRPGSALARGVHITELSDGCTNPEPIVLQETDILMEQHLSASKLQALTGTDNLETVTLLELKVDTSETSLNNFGALLPNLTVLKLSGSVIPNIRDLGSSLHHLEVLWMPRCGLGELDGISSMLRLRELYLAYNEIVDISALGMLEELEILDLEGNNVDDIGQIQYLTLCSKLQHLTLDGNPICVTPTVHAEEVDYNYREAIRKILVHLSVLDDKSLTETDTSVNQNVFDADWAYLEELQQDALVMESMNDEQETAVAAAGRPTTAALRPATAYRPGSALRPSSGFRPMSSRNRPASISGGRPSTAWTESSKRRPASSDAVEVVEPASALTRGVVICGNPSKALRARRSSTNSQDSIDMTSHSLTSQPSPQTPTEADSSPRLESLKGRGGTGTKESKGEEEERIEVEEEEEAVSSEGRDLRLLMEELQSWKMEHEKRLEKIRESKAPQVFTIDHNAGAGDLSDNQSDLSDADDLDFRPDSAMDLYHRQQAERSWGSTHPAAGATNASRVAENRTEDSVAFAQEARVGDRQASKQLKERQLKDYEKSLDEDQHLLKEYQRLQALERQQEKAHGVEPGGPRELRELRVPSAGPLRPHSPRRGVSPKPAPFPTGMAEPPSLSPGRESPFREQRPRKVKIGPTGLPGSSHTQQPQIRDVLAPAGKPGLGGLVPPGPLRPPSSSSSSLQHRIRRTLPEVPPLPSRPPPVTKS